ncbi:MAG: sigma-70 family RNA polymerase sigma factor [Nannocystaceae bacterium]
MPRLFSEAYLVFPSISMPDLDLELLEAWRGGDAKAGNALFDRYFDAVFRFFRNKVADHADDLVQQTFLALVQARDRFRGDSSFRTYLFTAARSKLFNYLEATRRARGRGSTTA